MPSPSTFLFTVCVSVLWLLIVVSVVHNKAMLVDGLNLPEGCVSNAEGMYYCEEDSTVYVTELSSLTTLEHIQISNAPSASSASAAATRVTITFNPALTGIAGDAFKSLPNLVEVRITDNGVLEDLPVGLFDSLSSSLTFVDLSRNRLTQLPEKLFSKNKNLRVFAARTNQLTTLPRNLIYCPPDKPFVTNPSISGPGVIARHKLYTMDVSDNRIRILPTTMLKCATSLQRLDMSRNQLQVLSGEALGRSEVLYELQLFNNEIGLIGSNVFKYSTPRILNMANNPSQCSTSVISRSSSPAIACVCATGLSPGSRTAGSCVKTQCPLFISSSVGDTTSCAKRSAGDECRVMCKDVLGVAVYRCSPGGQWVAQRPEDSQCDTVLSLAPAFANERYSTTLEKGLFTKLLRIGNDTDAPFIFYNPGIFYFPFVTVGTVTPAPLSTSATTTTTTRKIAIETTKPAFVTRSTLRPGVTKSPTLGPNPGTKSTIKIGTTSKPLFTRPKPGGGGDGFTLTTTRRRRRRGIGAIATVKPKINLDRSFTRLTPLIPPDFFVQDDSPTCDLPAAGVGVGESSGSCGTTIGNCLRFHNIKLEENNLAFDISLRRDNGGDSSDGSAGDDISASCKLLFAEGGASSSSVPVRLVLRDRLGDEFAASILVYLARFAAREGPEAVVDLSATAGVTEIAYTPPQLIPYGSAPVVVRYRGKDLPAGLAVDPLTGQVTGVPEGPGADDEADQNSKNIIEFTVIGFDKLEVEQSGRGGEFDLSTIARLSKIVARLRLAVYPGLRFLGSSEDGTIGKPFFSALPQPRGGKRPYRYECIDCTGNNVLVQGVTLNQETGRFAGIINKAVGTGTRSRTLRLTDANGATLDLVKKFSFYAALSVVWPQNYQDRVVVGYLGAIVTATAPDKKLVVVRGGGTRPGSSEDGSADLIYYDTVRELPSGLVINELTGSVTGLVSDAILGKWPVKVVASEPGSSEIVVSNGQFLLDLRECGPDTCGNGGICDDGRVGGDDGRLGAGNPYDGVFACDCTGTGFTLGVETGRCDTRVEIREVDGGGGNGTQAAEINSAALDAASVAGIATGAGLLAIAMLVLAVVLHRRRRAHPYDFEAHLKILQERGLCVSESAYRKPREVRRGRVQLLDALGRGAFGEVHKGILDEKDSTGRPAYTVAVKTLHPSAGSSTAVDELMREASVMAQFDHRNVLQLVGVCTTGTPILMLAQYCENGSLLAFLRRTEGLGVLSDLALLRMCCDVAAGMEYLAEQQFVHRDLAARNVLLDAAYVCVIGDFGMARDLGEEEEYHMGSSMGVPVRWTALEALESRCYSQSSDVWSFGVLCHEVWSEGALPYKGMNNAAVWTQIKSGHRLPCPPRCPSEVYRNIMQPTWHTNPAKRPSFKQLHEFLIARVPSASHGSARINLVKKSISSSVGNGGNSTTGAGAGAGAGSSGSDSGGKKHMAQSSGSTTTTAAAVAPSSSSSSSSSSAAVCGTNYVDLVGAEGQVLHAFTPIEAPDHKPIANLNGVMSESENATAMVATKLATELDAAAATAASSFVTEPNPYADPYVQPMPAYAVDNNNINGASANESSYVQPLPLSDHYYVEPQPTQENMVLPQDEKNETTL